MLQSIIEKVERTFAPPPEGTPMTPDAYHALTSWGMTRNQIYELKALVREFDGSYLNCPAKIEAIQILHINASKVVVPRLDNAIERGIGGNCKDVSDVLIARLHASGLIDTVNSKLKDKIQIYIAHGRNRTHFCYGNGNHVWAGLVRSSDDDLKNMVVLDGAYQEISHIKTNGYRLSEAKQSRIAEVEPAVELGISEIYIRDNGIAAYGSNDTVLGLSQDKSVSFSLGFAYKNGYVPFIRVGHENGEDAAIFLINPLSGKINCDYRDKSFALTSASSTELELMLKLASQFKFIKSKKRS